MPPRASAVPSSGKGDGSAQSPRDRPIQLIEPSGSPDIAARGRMGWQKATGYGRRNQAKTAMARYKHLIGPKLRARSLPAQQGEVAIAVAVLNTACSCDWLDCRTWTTARRHSTDTGKTSAAVIVGLCRHAGRFQQQPGQGADRCVALSRCHSP